jgi:hypothetical protein
LTNLVKSTAMTSLRRGDGWLSAVLGASLESGRVYRIGLPEASRAGRGEAPIARRRASAITDAPDALAAR